MKKVFIVIIIFVAIVSCEKRERENNLTNELEIVNQDLDAFNLHLKNATALKEQMQNMMDSLEDLTYKGKASALDEVHLLQLDNEFPEVLHVENEIKDKIMHLKIKKERLEKKK